MSKEKVRLFLASLIALEEEFDATLDQYVDGSSFVKMGGDYYNITPDYKLVDDEKERRANRGKKLYHAIPVPEGEEIGSRGYTIAIAKE